MTTWLLLLWGLTIILLVIAAAVRSPVGRLSRYELQRRAEQGDAHARSELQQYQQSAVLLGAFRAKQYGLVALGAYCVTAALGIGWGIILTLGVVVVAPALSRWSPVVSLGRRWYAVGERWAPRLIQRAPWLAWLLRTEPIRPPQWQLGSREELTHIIDQSGAHLGAEERQLLLRSLAYEQRTVAEIMTPAAHMTTIDRHELLGPLVLDDLHKTGHSFFPVIDETPDRIIGILAIEGFLSLDNKQSMTAETAMTSHLVYVRDTASLRAAVKLFLQSHQHVLLVEDEQGATVGLITLYDCLTTLFGRS